MPQTGETGYHNQAVLAHDANFRAPITVHAPVKVHSVQDGIIIDEYANGRAANVVVEVPEGCLLGEDDKGTTEAVLLRSKRHNLARVVGEVCFRCPLLKARACPNAQTASMMTTHLTPSQQDYITQQMGYRIALPEQGHRHDFQDRFDPNASEPDTDIPPQRQWVSRDKSIAGSYNTGLEYPYNVTTENDPRSGVDAADEDLDD